MKKLSETYKDLGIAFAFPIEIKDQNGNETYYENICGSWYRYEYDENGNVTYFDSSSGSCAGKIIEVGGRKYKLTEL